MTEVENLPADEFSGPTASIGGNDARGGWNPRNGPMLLNAENGWFPWFGFPKPAVSVSGHHST